MTPRHVYELRPRKDRRGVDLIRMLCHSVDCGTVNQTQSNNVTGYAKHEN